MRREAPFRSFSFMFILMMVVWLVLSFGSGSMGRRLSKAEFETILAGGDVAQVVILQNRETPTGEAQLVYASSDGKTGRERYFVSDVNKLQEQLEAQHIDYVLDNVPESSDWMNYLLPSLVTAGCCLLIFLNFAISLIAMYLFFIIIYVVIYRFFIIIYAGWNRRHPASVSGRLSQRIGQRS